MKLNIQSMHTPGLLLATNLVQLANSIEHARSLVTAAYSHAREIATAEANHEAADFCGDPYAHNCGRPHCRPSDSYTGPQPPLTRRFFEVDAVAEAAPLPAGVPEGWKLVPMEPTPEMREAFHASYERYEEGYGECPDSQWKAMLRNTPTPPAPEQQRAVFAIPDMDEHLLQILGRPNFRCGHIAQVLRLGGAEINPKAEHEQAAVVHWMLTLYLAHGAKWWEVATEEIKRIQSEHPAEPSLGGE